MNWRKAEPRDSGAIARLALEILGDYPEGEDIFAERIRLAPEGCFALCDDMKVVGYAISHPWRRRNPPHLNHLIGEIPADADCWYLHDISIRREARGVGAGGVLLAQLERVAKEAHMPVMAMVAVNNASGYWERFGFADRTNDALRSVLKSYDANAIYMEKGLKCDSAHPCGTVPTSLEKSGCAGKQLFVTKDIRASED